MTKSVPLVAISLLLLCCSAEPIDVLQPRPDGGAGGPGPGSDGGVSELQIEPAIAPSGVVASPYAMVLSARGGVGDRSWRVIEGQLPAGLTLESQGELGLIQGTPAAPGNFSFSVQVQDAAGDADTVSFDIEIVELSGLLGIDIGTGRRGAVGRTFTLALEAHGGSGTGYQWTLSGAPDGLSLERETGASTAITGTVFSSFEDNVVIELSDSDGNLARRTVFLELLRVPPAQPLTITSPSDLMPTCVNQAYQTQLEAEGGTEQGYVWSVTSGAPPVGLSLNALSGVLEGRAVFTGRLDFEVTVTDSGGNQDTALLAISSDCPLEVTSSGVDPLQLPPAYIALSYSFQFEATGGTYPYSWDLAPGSAAPPPGLVVLPDGRLQGISIDEGTYSFSVQVTDASAATAVIDCTIMVVAGTPPLTVPPQVLPNGTTTNDYSYTAWTFGGAGPAQWRLVQGDLPVGLSLTPGGTIVGRPLVEGVFNFRLQAEDPMSALAENDFQIVIQNLDIVTAVIPGMVQNEFYSVQFVAQGGVGDYTWTLTDGTLPLGIALNSERGTLTGTVQLPSDQGGPFEFTITATDEAQNIDSRRYFSLLFF